ncbi:MAG: M23 family metallopeptidase [Deltaproteobacteria bacterium]|nr:M23 family metallopeptidase [Deltaproteobacteria bacterium]
MKKLVWCLIGSILLVSSCATQGPVLVRKPYGPFYVGNLYGGYISYGEGRHAGIDFDLSIGTPIIAASDGEVVYLAVALPDEKYSGGIGVALGHGDRIGSFYGHLTKVFIEKGQLVKRGQLIGLSGASNSGYRHLHFGIYKRGELAHLYSKSYDPDEFWTDGEPKCFNPATDYSKYSQEKITLPVACGEYANELISKIK